MVRANKPTRRRVDAGPQPPRRRTRGGERPAQDPGEGGIEPQKLHKMLAQSGLGSRRDMEVLVQAGRVSVNGKVAEVGQRVGPDDRVRVDGRPVRLRFEEPVRVLLYHKPEGEIVSLDDPLARANVFAKLPRIRGAKWISVGRLDFNTSGLLMFTTSGELANRLMHPRSDIEREYAVRVLGRLAPEQMARLQGGIELEDGPAHFESVVDGGGEGANHWYHVILKEGRKREVRRLFEAMGLTVSRLIRVRFGIIPLPPRLRKGHWVDLDPQLLSALLAQVGMPG
ncbi:MAG: pseudouridine synthase [Betaproteobacteria bacterium]|nr:pseudouridine synthase [Betaproteobacteria bacterium]